MAGLENPLRAKYINAIKKVPRSPLGYYGVGLLSKQARINNKPYRSLDAGEGAAV